jgi:anti-sigma factor RsiW
MNCKSVQNYLSAYLDGELSGSEGLAVREHLSQCHECESEARHLRTLKELLRGLPVYEPSEGFEERLVSNVVRKAERRNRIFNLNLGFNWRLGAGFAVTAAIASLVVLQITERHVPRSEPTNSNDGLALEIGRDQMFLAGNDPLSGARFAVPTSYAKR